MKTVHFSVLALAFFNLNLEARSSCRKVSVFITLKKGEGCTAVMGHSGVAIEDEYYDWGPGSDKNGAFLNYIGAIYGSKGRPYDDENVEHGTRKKLATAKQIRTFLDGTIPLHEEGYVDEYNKCEAYEISNTVTERQAALAQYYWEWIYQTEPYFHVLKNQCTNVAFGSLKWSGILSKGRVVLLPSTFLKKLSTEFVSTCPDSIGKKPAIKRLK